MPLGGWKCEQLAAVLRLSSPTKATQAWEPAVNKVARAMLANPVKTMFAIAEAMELLEGNRANGRGRLTEEEFDRLWRMQTGRLDREELGRPVG